MVNDFFKLMTRPPTNTYWAQPDALLAGEYPGARDPRITLHKLAALMDEGVTAFLDLTEPHELKPYAEVLQTLASDRGTPCAYKRMPILDMYIPDTPQYMRAILAQIRAWQNERRIVYVHCWGGVGRTGTVVGCHFVDGGMTGTEALQRIAELWQGMSDDKRDRHPQSPQTPTQLDYVRHWATNQT